MTIKDIMHHYNQTSKDDVYMNDCGVLCYRTPTLGFDIPLTAFYDPQRYYPHLLNEILNSYHYAVVFKRTPNEKYPNIDDLEYVASYDDIHAEFAVAWAPSATPVTYYQFGILDKKNNKYLPFDTQLFKDEEDMVNFFKIDEHSYMNEVENAIIELRQVRGHNMEEYKKIPLFSDPTKKALPDKLKV